ncbi:MAG: D-aminoacyl-tRNA deacylase [Candidatus Nanopelagicales bacterium]
MRAVVQRADGASVVVDGAVVGSFDGPGLVVLIGVTHDDDSSLASSLADKVYDLRIFGHEHARAAGVSLAPDAGREVSASDLGLPVLVISQFTLYADTRKGRRPTWDAAAPGPVAQPLVDAVAERFRARGAEVSSGVFGADMRVSLINDGPMTITLDTTR